MKSTKGTKLPSGAVVVKGKTSQTMRCPRCKAQVQASTGTNGKPQFNCGACGAQFSARAF